MFYDMAIIVEEQASAVGYLFEFVTIATLNKTKSYKCWMPDLENQQW